MHIQKVAIIGGGTAGWLAANHLAKQSHTDEHPREITVIEAPDIPIIGVGEGTVPAIRQSLKSIGISETEFIRSCDVTFKQSIRFENWLSEAKYGKHNFYHHLFEAPNPLVLDLTPLFLKQAVLKQSQDAYVAPFADIASTQFAVCEANLAPKLITTPEYQGVQGYAYHLNAAKFATLLAKHATTQFGVKHVKAKVNDCTFNDDGDIKALILDGKQAEFDFYIDCSGTHSVLFEKALNVPFVNKSSQLFVDNALVVQVPTNEQQEIPPFTKATAHQAGWTWDIALPHRRGVGLVYSASHLSDEKVYETLDKYLKNSASPKQIAQTSIRKIPMKVGYREKFWVKNCVALGLSQGFLEPIEATSIMLTDFACQLLAKRFPSTKSQNEIYANEFNRTMTYAWERVVEFAKMHYCLSDREDSDFWFDNRQPATIPTGLQQKLELWRYQVPIPHDFFSKFEAFNLENYLYVLYGMHFKTQTPEFNASHWAILEQQKQMIARKKQQLLENLPSHRALLNKIYQYGLQKV